MGNSGSDLFRASRTWLRAVKAREKAQSDQASQAAPRRLISPALRSRCLVPSVTTALYTNTASKALRKESSRGSAQENYSFSSHV
jgi:hypothetical protein